MKIIAIAALLLASTISQAQAQPTVPVTVDNFIRAETDTYFANSVRDGGFGKFHHNRAPFPIDHQSVIRGNRDTLYSSGVFDLDAGPVTITLPDAGKRYMSVQVIDEDHYTITAYGRGTHVVDKATLGTRYAIVGVRTLLDPNDPDDVKRVHALQDAIVTAQPGGPGTFAIPNWDKASLKKVRDALLVLASTVSDTRRAFGSKSEVDPIQHLIGTASAWGANAPRDAIYLTTVPDRNDGQTPYTLKIGDMPVDGFWSVSVYNADGYYEANPANAYTLNNITAKKDHDGAITVQFGGCGEKAANCLPIMKGWNYMTRLYRPRREILDGSWTFPAAKPAS
jgi:hypothetical protein